ncbi:MAG TPA: PAS domain-containing sensor histidine kinase, partial [Pseudomonas sp.]|nr:PAS domain-containing sensor histidine kinase [Pseudomonas sp.]
TECRIRHPERGLIWVECRASAERRRDGSVVWQGFVTEITEVMEATRALQKSESRFRAMVGNLPGAVYRCRNDGERRMRYVSEGIERLTGYPAEHFTGDGAQRYCALIHPDDRDWARLAPERGSHELTYRLRHADG